MKKKVAVSIFNSKDEIGDLIDLESTDVDFIHIDVGDGRFIERKYNPYKILQNMDYVLSKKLDVHLMVNNPKKYINMYSKLNTEYIYIHIELGNKIEKYIKLIKDYNIKAGIVINPDTNIELLKDYLDIVDAILVMSVVPGAGGQSFIENSSSRLKEIKSMIEKRNIVLNIDGGINDKTISKVKESDIVVSGSYVLNGENLQERINTLR